MKQVQVGLRLAPQVLEMANAAAEREHMSRNRLIERAIVAYTRERPPAEGTMVSRPTMGRRVTRLIANGVPADLEAEIPGQTTIQEALDG